MQNPFQFCIPPLKTPQPLLPQTYTPSKIFESQQNEHHISRDDLEDCEWYSPTGEKYEGQISSSRSRSNSKVSDNENVQVQIDDRRDECILTIKNVRKEHEGAWECVAYEGRDEVGISRCFGIK